MKNSFSLIKCLVGSRSKAFTIGDKSVEKFRPGPNFGAILSYLFEATNKVLRLAHILAVADLRNMGSPRAILQAHVIGE